MTLEAVATTGSILGAILGVGWMMFRVSKAVPRELCDERHKNILGMLKNTEKKTDLIFLRLEDQTKTLHELDTKIARIMEHIDGHN